MKILICGSNGQLGWDCNRVFQKKHDVTALNRDKLDITSKSHVLTAVDGFRPDVVINCAAYTRVDQCETYKNIAWAVNAGGAANIAEACEAFGACMLHVSTDYVFDGTKEPPAAYTELDETAPVSVYGSTKLEGEKLIASITDRHIIVRTAWLYGISGSNFLKTMLGLSLADPGKQLKVVSDQFGSPTWTLRLALQLMRLVDIDARGIYNASAEGYCSWYELAVCFLKKMDVPFNIIPCTTEEYPTPAARPRNSILENGRLKNGGNNLMTGWRHGLEQFVSRYRQELLNEVLADQRRNYG